MGTIESVRPDEMVVRDRDGEAHAIRLTPGTDVHDFDGNPASIPDLRPGERVVVDFEREGATSRRATFVSLIPNRNEGSQVMRTSDRSVTGWMLALWLGGCSAAVTAPLHSPDHPADPAAPEAPPAQRSTALSPEPMPEPPPPDPRPAGHAHHGGHS